MEIELRKLEIELKFLIRGNVNELRAFLEKNAKSVLTIKQNYIHISATEEIRVRRTTSLKKPAKYVMTHKKDVLGLSRHLEREETETEISSEVFNSLSRASIGTIDKTRYVLASWEVDFFADGLVLAEHETDHPTAEVELPFWLKDTDWVEVTHDPMYRNQSIALGKHRLPRTTFNSYDLKEDE